MFHFNKLSQVKTGAVLSYIIILLNSLYGLVLTPLIVSRIGVDDYGVYKTITSFTATLIVLDLGIGGTVQRYIASYISKKEHHRIPNFMAMSLIIASILCGLLFLCFFVLFFLIGPIYSDTFNAEQIELAKKIFCISAFTVLLRIFENVFNGLITGHNKFIFGNGINLMSLVTRIVLIVIFLQFSTDATGIVAVNLITSVLFLLSEVLYIKIKLGIKIKFSKWDISVFKDAGKYTALMFITSIVTQITSNIDNIVIGSIRGPNLVTIYSVGLLIFAMFSQISSSISGVMLPTVTNILNSKDGNQKVVNVIIKAGRIQFILLGACIIGFIIVGKDFINLWMGEGFEDVYIITIILIVPALFELCINTCLSILRAKNKLEFRTIALIVSTIVNLIVTIVLVKKWSYIGAAIGTSVSYFMCSIVAMNWYYIKKLNLPMGYIYRKIIGKTWICLLLAGAAIKISSIYFKESWIGLFINVLVFCLVYSISLYIFKLSEEERNKHFKFFKRTHGGK